MEAYQFAHDAAACDAWLQQQHTLMEGMPLDACRSVADAEQLLRRLDGMEKAALPWEERFAALQKLTEVWWFYKRHCLYCVHCVCVKLSYLV